MSHAPKKTEQHDLKAYQAPTLDKRAKLVDVSESGPVVISGIVISP